MKESTLVNTIQPAINLIDISRVYTLKEGKIRKRYTEIEALKLVTLKVFPRELFGLLGPNGAGKTTLIKILTTILLPTNGRAEILGYDVVHNPSQVRHLIGLAFGGDRGLYNHLTIKDNLVFWAALYKISKRDIPCRVDTVVKLMGLSAIADRHVETLSRGMRQRLHLARALLPNPSILFLDEPTIGLDPVASRALRKVIQQLREEGITIFLTTHDMQEAEELCDRIAIIDRGEIRFLGTPSELKQRMIQCKSVSLVVEGVASPKFQEIEKWPEIHSIAYKEINNQCHIDIIYSQNPSFMRDLVLKLDDQHIIELRRKEPALEDAYIAILGDRGLEVKEE